MARKPSLGPHLYVLAEADDPDGPVKVGMNGGSASGSGRLGLQIGNWRELTVLHREPVDRRDLRWREWLIHRRLRDRRVRGEWFRVRDLVRNNDWARFLQDVLDNKLPGLYDWRLGDGEHHLSSMQRIDQPGAGARQFRAICSCGHVVNGPRGRTLGTVLALFASGHLRLAKSDPVVQEALRPLDRQPPDDPGTAPLL